MTLLFDTKNKEMPWPLIWGFVAMLVWALVLNTFSITHEFGKAPGLEVGSWVIIKSLSRHLDPYILGPLVAFLIWSFRVSPPTKFSGSDLSGMNVLCLFIGFAVMNIIAKYIRFDHGAYNILIMLGLCILLPFGWKSSIGLTLLMSVVLWYVRGIAVVAFFVLLVWLGKLIVWFIVNSFRLGYSGAFKKFKEHRALVTSPPDPASDSDPDSAII